MSSNSSQFLDAFAEIEKLLRRISGSERQVPFYHVVDAAAQRSPDVRRHRDDLNTVQEALRHTEYDANWQLLPRTALLSEVVNAFDAAERNGKRLDALLVTQSGRATESLLGIVTIHDVPKVFRELTK
jgi:hypothetical protein